MERNHSDNIRCIEKGQPEYPEKLKAYDHMPEKLYIKGRLPDPERPCAAEKKLEEILLSKASVRSG